MRQAPSRIEYSEWTWRWTKGGLGHGKVILGATQDRTGSADRCPRERARGRRGTDRTSSSASSEGPPGECPEVHVTGPGRPSGSRRRARPRAGSGRGGSPRGRSRTSRTARSRASLCGKTWSSSLLTSVSCAQRDGLLEQRAADALAAVAGARPSGRGRRRGGSPDAGRARREPADDLAAVGLGDEHGGAEVAADRLQVAALVGDAAPGAVA